MTDWTKTCWHMRYSPDAESCGKPATFRGPENSESSFVRAWRACDEHRIDTDVPIEVME